MPHTPSRRQLLQGMAASLLVPSLCAHAQSWPGSRTVRFVSLNPAGDPIDIRLREFLKDLTTVLGGATLITDNKPGAGGVLAHQSVLNAPADGLSVLLGNASMTIIPTYFRKLGYNPAKDFSPVAFSGTSAIGLAIPASRPETTLADWLAWARRQKGDLNFASPGGGSVSHLYGFELADRMGIQATHIPYKGSAPALLGMMAGETQFTMLDIFGLRPMLSNGGLRLLAVTGAERSKHVPDIPTFKELGHEGYERVGWSAYFMKTGTPTPILDQVARAINQVNALPGWEERRKQIWSAWPGPLSPAELARLVQAETETWAAVIRKAGVYGD